MLYSEKSGGHHIIGFIIISKHAGYEAEVEYIDASEYLYYEKEYEKLHFYRFESWRPSNSYRRSLYSYKMSGFPNIFQCCMMTAIKTIQNEACRINFCP